MIMNFNLDLSKYSTNALYSTYEFIFAQWVGGQLMAEEITENVATIGILNELVMHLRLDLTAREDFNPDGFKSLEDQTIERATTLSNIPAEKLNDIFEKFQEEAKNRFKEVFNEHANK